MLCHRETPLGIRSLFFRPPSPSFYEYMTDSINQIGLVVTNYVYDSLMRQLHNLPIFIHSCIIIIYVYVSILMFMMIGFGLLQQLFKD